MVKCYFEIDDHLDGKPLSNRQKKKLEKKGFIEIIK